MTKLRTQNEIMKSWKGNYDEPLVTVRCMTYNQEPYIEDAIRGFLIQETDFPFQIIIHDDASTDDTAKIVKRYEEEYPQIIKVWYQTQNSYRLPPDEKSALRKPFHDMIKGKYIAICEGDDYWTDPSKLQKQVGFLEANSEYVVAYNNADKVSPDRQLLVKDYGHKFDLSEEELMKAPIIPLSSICMRNIDYTPIPERRYMYGGHTATISQFGLHGKGKYLGDQIKANGYRVHEGGIWSQLGVIEQHFVAANTYFWLYKFYKRINNDKISKYWFDRFIERNSKIHHKPTKTKPLVRVGRKIKQTVRNVSTRVIKLYYFNRIINFGDTLNTLIIPLFSKRRVVFSPVLHSELISIGSLLEHLKLKGKRNFRQRIRYILSLKKVHIWGSGFIKEKTEDQEAFLRKTYVHAVRGELTKNRILEMKKVKYKNIAIGDPGLFVSDLLKGKSIIKKYKLGIIPHYVDSEDPIFVQVQQTVSNSIIINVHDDPLKIIELISQCETVISTAMHGLIAADSFGIPNRWCKVSDKIKGNDYKFFDYYSAYGIKNPKPLDLNKYDFSRDLVSEIKDQYEITIDQVKSIKNNLALSFPKSLAH